MKSTKTFSLMAAALVLLVLIASVYASKSESDLEYAVKNTYTFKTYLKDDDVKVQSTDGVVTLTGTVADEARKLLAGETVANLPDVKRVDNRLEIKGESSPDTWLMTKVKTTLLLHRNVSATTNVDVKDGIVTLRGEADNQAQKDLTTEYATDIEGVKAVNNRMTVAGSTGPARTVGDKIDDASITAQVKMSLLYHRSTSGLQTRVETKDGLVTLSGKAGSKAEKDLAAHYAMDVSGVKEVRNLMTVE